MHGGVGSIGEGVGERAVSRREGWTRHGIDHRQSAFIYAVPSRGPDTGCFCPAALVNAQVEGNARSGSGATRERVGNRDEVLTATQDSGSSFTALKGIDRNRAAAAAYELAFHWALDHIHAHLALDLQTNSDGSPPPQ